MSKNCQSCGNPVGDSPFCPNCGAPVKAAKKALKLPSKKILIPVAAVVVLILLVALIAPAFGGSGMPTYGSRLYPIYSADDDTTYFADGAKLLEDTFDGDYGYAVHSIDYSTSLYYGEEEVLWAVSRNSMVELGEEVIDYCISADGSTAVWIDEDKDLYAGNTKTGKIEEIASDVIIMIVSPDGNFVVYIVAEENEEAVTWFYDGKKSVELGEGLYPIAVSNGGKYLYCEDDKNNLVLADKKGDTEKICSDLESGSFLFNRDLSQIIFRAKGKWYISVKGGEKQKLDIDVNYLYMATPRWSQYGSFDFATVYNVKSLAGNFFYGGNSLNMYTVMYLKNNLECEEVTDESASINLSDDGKRLYFRSDNNRLKYVTTSKPVEAVDVAKHVVGYVVTDGGKTVYYRDEDNVLLCQKGKKTVEIEEDVYALYKTHDEKILFLAERDRNGNGTLYTVKGDKAVEISEEVSEIVLRPSATYYLEETDDAVYDVYAAVRGVKFELLLEDA